MGTEPAASSSLPDDIDVLRAMVIALTTERDTMTAERDILLERNERLQHLLLKLGRMQFGTKSERLPEEQLQLGLEAIEQAIAQNEAEAEKRDPKLREDRIATRRSRNAALPTDLPRIEVTLEPDDKACPCCRATMIVIGEDSSERLDKIPAQYRVIVTKRPKLACRACPGTVVQEPAPPRLIEGGIPTEALVAQVVVSRFADHQPLYRKRCFGTLGQSVRVWSRPVPGHQFVDAILRPAVHQPGEQLSDIGERIDAVQFARLDQRRPA